MSPRRCLAAAVGALGVGSAAPAHAGPPVEAPAASPSSPPRALPDYDGRGHEVQEGDGAGVWVARIVLAPLYLISEFLFRRPLGALTVAVEKANLPNKVYDFFAFDFFAFGPDHKMEFYPAGFVELGFLPSFGVFASWNDALVKGNAFTLHYEVWPPDLAMGGLKDRYEIDERNALVFGAAGSIRPDLVFYGIGPRSLGDHRSRYKIAKFDANAKVDARFWRSSHLELGGGIRKVDLSDGHWQSDPSLTAEAATGAFPVPFGLDRGYVAPYVSAVATLDPHPDKAVSRCGVKLVADGEFGGDVQHRVSGWIRYGGTVKGYADLNDRGRVLSLSLGAIFADPTGPDPVPFTELVSLGGDKWMYGFFEGRLRGRSALVASLDYQWPVGPKLNGVLQLATGNVFDAHLDDFRFDLLRLAGSLGLRVDTDPAVQFLVGFGTETFDHGAQVDSVRLYFGLPRDL